MSFVDESAVGGLELPIAQGAALETLGDPMVNALTDYLAFCLRTDLNSKLTQLTPTSADACPVEHIFPYNPEETFVRNPFPALYAWEDRTEVIEWTMRWQALKRTVVVMYVFEELLKPVGFHARHGIIPAVAKSFAKASERRFHPDYNNGRPISLTTGCLSWRLTLGDQIFLHPIPDKGERGRQIKRGFPAYKAKFEIIERIDPRRVEDLLADGVISINTGDNVNDTVEFMQRIVEGQNGS